MAFNRYTWRELCARRSLASVTGRALILLALFGLALAACGQGSRGWLLSERGLELDGGPNVSEAGAAGEMTSGGAGAAGEATLVPSVDHCPTRFASACSPIVVVDNRDASASGKLFSDAISDPTGALTCITRDVCNVLFRKTSEVRKLRQINLIIEDFAGTSETWSTRSESTIHMSSRYLQQVANAHLDVQREITGIFYYHAANMYQYDDGNGVLNSWLVEGVAEYARHAGGYLSMSERRPGGKYDTGNRTTGFFLVWLDTQFPDFVYELNQSLIPSDSVVWSPLTFEDITGQSVDTLWAAYQTSF